MAKAAGASAGVLVCRVCGASPLIHKLSGRCACSGCNLQLPDWGSSRSSMQDAHPLTSQRLGTPDPLRMEGRVQDGKLRSGGSSYASTPAAKKKVDEGIWASLSKTAKSLFSEEDDLPREDEVRVDRQQAPAMKQTVSCPPNEGVSFSFNATSLRPFVPH